MQNKICKRLISCLLAFVMVFSMVSFNLTTPVHAAITNPTLDQAINDKLAADPNFGSGASMDLSYTGVIGEVDLSEIKSDSRFSNVTYVNLSHTSVTNVIAATGVTSSVQYTFCSTNATRKNLIADGQLIYDLSVANDITVGDILDRIAISNDDNTAAVSDLIDVMNVTLMRGSTTVASASLVNASNPSATVFPSSALTGASTTSTYSVDVGVIFNNDGSSTIYSLSIPLTVSMYYLEVVDTNLNYDTAASSYYAYPGDELEFTIEKFDGAGNHLDITSAEAATYDIDLSDSAAGAPITPASFSYNVVNGLLVITVSADDGFGTTPAIGVSLASVDVYNNAGALLSGTSLNFEVRSYNIYTNVSLQEYNPDGSASSVATGITSVPAGSPYVATNRMYINFGTSIASFTPSNVGNNNPYTSRTVYPLLLNSNLVSYERKGMVSVNTSSSPGVTAQLVEYTSGSGSYVGISIVAETSLQAGSTGSIIIDIDDYNSTATSITIPWTILSYSPEIFEIYQIPVNYYENIITSASDLEAAINSANPAVYGINLVSRYKLTAGSGYSPDASVNYENAKIPQGGSAYFVPVSMAKSTGAPKLIVGQVEKWYDYTSTPSIFGTPATAFVSSTDFMGEVDNAGQLINDQAFKVTVDNNATPTGTVTAAVVMNDGQGGQQPIPVIIEAIEKTVTEYILGEDDGSGGYISYDNDTSATGNIAKVPIGISSNFAVLAIYSNGNTAAVPYSAFVSSVVANDGAAYQAVNPHFAVSDDASGSDDIVLRATEYGGYDSVNYIDELYGEISTITLTDGDGNTWDIKVKLDYPVITGLEYYIASEEFNELDLSSVISTQTISSSQTRKFDYSSAIQGSDTSSYPGKIDIAKGESMEVYVVPVFSNTDRNNLVTSNNYYNYSALYGELGIEGINASRTNGGSDMYSIAEDGVTGGGGMSNIASPSGIADSGTLISLNAGDQDAAHVGDDIDVDIYTWDHGTGHVVQLAGEAAYYAGISASAPEYSTYDLTSKAYGVELKAEAQFTASEHFVSEITVEDYTTKFNANYTSFTPISSGVSVSGDVGSTKSFRAKIGYNDAEELDFSLIRGAWNPSAPTTVTDGVFFMQDSANSYNSANGPTPPIGGLTLGWHALDFIDVLRAYYMSNFTLEYWNGNNFGIVQGLDYFKSGPDLHDDVIAQAEKINIAVIEDNGVTWSLAGSSDIEVGWSAAYPGVIDITPKKPGTFKVLFYQTITDSTRGNTFDVAATELGSSSVYSFDLVVDAVAGDIVLAGEDVYYDSSNSEYVYDQVPGRFYIYPVVQYQGYTAGSTAPLLVGDIENTAGLDFMYPDDFPSYANQLQITEDSGGGVRFTPIIRAVTLSDGSTVDVICFEAYAALKTLNRQFYLDWTGGLTYTPTVTSYNTLNSSILNGTNTGHTAGVSINEFNYSVNPDIRVYDIDLHSVTADRGNSTPDVIGTSDSNAAYVSEKLTLQIEYMMENGSSRSLVNSELLAINATSGFTANQLQITADPANPGTCGISSHVDGTGSYLYFVPSEIGDYTFYFETDNTAGANVPTLGPRSISFRVTEKLPGNETIYYGDIVTIACSLGGGLTPVYSLQSGSDPNGVLDLASLANGILRMTKNENSSATIDLHASDGTFKKSFVVTMVKDTGAGTLVPGTSLILTDGDYVRLREKVTYTSGAIEYYDIDVINYVTGDSNFLDSTTGNGIVIADGALATDGDQGFYSVSSTSGTGTVYSLLVQYSSTSTPLTYPSYNLSPSLTVAVGSTDTVYITSSSGTVDPDGVYLVYSGNTSSIAATLSVAANDQVKITGLTPGTVTIIAENAEGTQGASVTITVVSAISFNTHPQPQTVAEGATVTFSATASSGTSAISYQWQVSTDSGASWSNISGGTSNTLSFTAAVGDSGNRYRCEASDSYGNTIVSNGAELTVTTATPGTYSLSGTVYDLAYAPLIGATVTLTDSSNATTTATTDNSGAYNFTSLVSGTYTITASQTGYISVSDTVAVSNNITGKDFNLSSAAPAATYAIDGIIYDSLGVNVVTGAALTLTDISTMGTAGSATSDNPTGYYSIANVPDGNYVLTVSDPQNVYAVMQVYVTIAGANVTLDVYLDDNLPVPVALYNVSGIIYDNTTSQPINGATVTISGISGSVTTNSTGNYVLQNVPDGGTYVVIATEASYEPGNLSVLVLGGNAINQDIGLTPSSVIPSTYTVSGAVTEGSLTGPVIPGVAVYLDGASTPAATTDASGNYSISGISSGSHSFEFSAAGYVVRTTTLLISGNETFNTFLTSSSTPVAGPYTVSGQVTDSVTGSGVSGATVALGTYTAVTTDSSGNYTVTGVADGSYTLTASAGGYNTGTTTVTVNGANVTGADVSLVPTGSSATYTVSGKVTASSSGSGLSGATVKLTGSSGAATTSTDTNGDYSVAGLANGTYTMTVSRTGYTTSTVTITVNGGNVVQNVALSTGSGSGSSSGGGGGSSVNNTSNSSKKAEITLSKTTIKVGESTSASVILKKGSTTVALTDDADITWKIGNESIAAIMKDSGATMTLEGLKAGVTSVEITVKLDGVTYKGTVDLTVVADTGGTTDPGTTPPVTSSRFSDVPSSFWGYDSIMYLAGKSIVNGYENGTFRPNAEITRSEFVTMLSKGMGWTTANDVQKANAEAHFTDWSSIPEWAKSFWALAYDNGLMNGSLIDGLYYAEGGRNISRQEVCVVFAKLMDDEGTKEVVFNDAGQVASWAVASVKKCAANGLISGYADNTFKPLNSITRAESASIFYKYLSK